MQRRDFLKAASAGTLLVATPALARAATAADSTIEIFVNEPLGTISPNIYGHFTEHIGGVIYDGVWVGRDSKIPNIDGIRKSLVEALRRIKAPVIRWPGGCFADSYDWRDGIGPAARRPVRTNFWEVDPDAKRLHEKGVQLFDTNAFGTDEFVRFCRLSRAEPYLAANLRSLSPLDFDHWVEYCNSPAGSTTYARTREEAGARDPFQVHYWGIGNESWGCGGNFKPEDYASEFRRFTTWCPSYGVDLQFIAAGPNDNDTDWTRRFFAEIYAGPRAYRNTQFRGWSIHHYSHVANGDALQFGATEWYGLLRSADQMERIILDNWSIMSEYDPGHQVKLVVDEYGSWHRSGTEIDPTHIFGQQITLRDAVLTAMTLDCFNRHPEKVSMANCAQLVNNLNALFLAHEDRFWATPNFHAFDLYSAHQNGEAVRTIFSAPRVQAPGGDGSNGFWGLNGSASRVGKTVTLTAVNPSVAAPREAQITVRGATARSAAARVLTASSIQAHNTYERQNEVAPRIAPISIDGGTVRFQFAAASIARVTIELA